MARALRLAALLAVLFLVPRSAVALDLTWIGGASDISVTEAASCTLVVRSSGSEATLPPQWHLIWSTDSCYVEPIYHPCSDTTAKVRYLSSPASLAGVEANRIDAKFCATDSLTATVAWYVVELPADRHGQFRVVALDPADPESLTVLRSPVATFNGGCDEPLPPMIVRVATIHESTEYELTAVGVGLADVQTIALVAPDASWDQALTIDDASDTLLTATAALAAAVPACFVRATTDSGLISTYTLPAESEPEMAIEESGGGSCQDTFREVLLGPETIQPKDFAFVPGGWTPEGNWVFHLFYIRQNQFTKLYHGGVDLTEKNIGHAVSNDLIDWEFESAARDTAAIRTRGGKFDSLHVWAPHIVRRGVTYYMFYTGVDETGDQRMGLATSTDLFNWAQQDDPIFSFEQLGSWATPETHHYSLAAQFRDPFVMEDPDEPGDWLMYFVTVSGDLDSARTVVGYARSHGDFTDWGDDQPLYMSYNSGSNAESPHALNRQGKWWLFNTRAGASNPTVYAFTHPDSPSETTSSEWTDEGNINQLVIDEYTGEPSNAYSYWKGTEYLEISAVNDIAFLAAYNDQAVGISYIPVRNAASPFLFEEHCPVSALGVGRDSPLPPTVHLALLSKPGMGASIEFRVDLPASAVVQLGIFDVAGRRVATLADGMLPAGSTRVAWDGRDTKSGSARTGMYFASLRTPSGRKSVTVPLLR